MLYNIAGFGRNNKKKTYESESKEKEKNIKQPNICF